MKYEIKSYILLLLMLFVSIYSISWMWGTAQKTFDEQGEMLRASNTPTRYEYEVISVSHVNSFWSGNYYEVVYIGKDNVLSSKQFDVNDRFRVVPSNESRLVIENPEFNGYPLRTTLYWSGLK